MVSVIFLLKMQVKFLKSIVEHLINKQAVPIVDLLIGKKDVNEFIIAKKLKLTINQTRNILYKLSDYGLVSFIRKKDRKKGWFIYFWTLKVYKSLSLLEDKLRREYAEMEVQLKNRKEKRYYVCKTCNIEVTEEAALLNDFICPECENVYELADNQEIIKKLEKEIRKIKEDITLVISEREKEGEKLEKKKASKIKRVEKKKKADRKRILKNKKKDDKKFVKNRAIKRVDKEIKIIKKKFSRFFKKLKRK